MKVQLGPPGGALTLAFAAAPHTHTPYTLPPSTVKSNRRVPSSQDSSALGPHLHAPIHACTHPGVHACVRACMCICMCVCKCLLAAGNLAGAQRLRATPQLGAALQNELSARGALGRAHIRASSAQRRHQGSRIAAPTHSVLPSWCLIRTRPSKHCIVSGRHVASSSQLSPSAGHAHFFSHTNLPARTRCAGMLDVLAMCIAQGQSSPRATFSGCLWRYMVLCCWSV